MTTEPKFIPNEAVEVCLGDNAKLKVRMIDCVGYIVNSSLGYIEENEPRMVKTPWNDDAIPFEQAAEIGTKKVICEHSTIGLVVTTDGSICEIERDDYIDAENRVINELKEINKPFVILLNCKNPNSEDTKKLREELSEKHEVPVVALNCEMLEADDINEIIKTILFEFPVSEINLKAPKWIKTLSREHWFSKEIYENVADAMRDVEKIRDSRLFCDTLSECDYIDKIKIDGIDLGTGFVDMEILPRSDVFYKILGELSGLEISDEENLVNVIRELSSVKTEYDKVKAAIDEVNQKGYGIVSPTIDELTLEEPKIVKQGGRFGVKLRASAPSIHMIKANIETEVSPIVGTEKQSEELIKHMMSEFESDPQKIWDSNIFGKSLYELVNEGLHTKLSKMPDESRLKLQETLTRIINEGSGGLICIIL